MMVEVNTVVVGSKEHVEAVIRSRAGELVYWARCLYPEDPAKRQAEVAVLLQDMATAIAAGKVSLENVI